MNNAHRRSTFVSFLLDETGSMESIKDETLAGLNDYVKELQKAGGDVAFSLVTFNSSRTSKRYVAEPIDRVRPLAADDYQPNAMTPLIDAAVKTIKATAEAVAKRADDPAVVIAIQTDGLENVSVEYTAADLAILVKEKEAAGWHFTFLGAGLDAFAAAQAAGLDIAPGRVVAYARGLSREVFAASAANVAEFVASGDASRLDYSDAQRDRVGDNYTRRYLDPKTAPKAPAGGARKPTGKKDSGAAAKTIEKTRSSVDDFAL